MTATCTADIEWTLGNGKDFPKARYSPGHTLNVDGRAVVPHIGVAACCRQVGRGSSRWNCHMLSFLHVTRLAGFTSAAYRDHAEGVTEEIAPGKQAIAKTVLRSWSEWIGLAPEKAKLDHLHHEAHEVCIIANSVKTTVTVAA